MKSATALALAAALAALCACDRPKWAQADAPAAAEPPAPRAKKPHKVRVIPAVAGPTPPPPAWAASVIGKGLRDVYRKTGVCKGNADVVQQTYSGDPAGVQVHGWGWDLAKDARVQRVVLVDIGYRIVGAGNGGVPRQDVLEALPELGDANTGWNVDVPRTHGPLDAYGVVDGGEAVCPLGHVELGPPPAGPN